jgi:Tol biopolymer transport system component
MQHALRWLAVFAIVGTAGVSCTRAECRATDFSCSPFATFFASSSSRAARTCPALSPGRVSVSSAGVESLFNSQINLGSLHRGITPDGRYAVFTSVSDGLIPGDGNFSQDGFLHDRLTGETSRVTLANGGGEANSGSGEIGLSDDGRYIVFGSSATNLVAGDTNAQPDTFVYDRVANSTTRVSVATGGGESNNLTLDPAISADGRYVVFASYANNLVAGDTNGGPDIFVHDRNSGITTRGSLTNGGGEAAVGSGKGSISADGRYVIFDSAGADYVTGDINGQADIFVHDRQTSATTRVSVSSGGAEANAGSNAPAMSPDGRYVVFESLASNLVAGDTNGVNDVFLHDRLTGETRRVSVASDGSEAAGASTRPDVTEDGRYVSFLSAAANLVPGDANGFVDAFVHDVLTGTTVRVNLGAGGVEADGAVQNISMSAFCPHVLIESDATNLVPADTNGVGDVFVVGR